MQNAKRHMTAAKAASIADWIGVPLDTDFFTLSPAQLNVLSIAADNRRYTRPRNAQGCRNRTFWAYVQRAARSART